MDLTKSPQLPQHLIEKYERDAGRYWDLFYKRNQDRFFKDRHYFDREFPELLTASTILEVGCGVGNSIFPLLQLNPAAFVYACDFAASAIDIVRRHPGYAASGRVHAFVADITEEASEGPGSPGDVDGAGRDGAAAESRVGSGTAARSWGPGDLNGGCGHGSGDSNSTASRSSLASEVRAGSVDACTMVFVLSAVSPERMAAAVRGVARTLRPGSGRVLFRDYAAGDLAQERLAGGGRAQRIADNFYARWDGTRAFYFSEEGLRSLFESEGFRCESCFIHQRVVENRKLGQSMGRRYIQAVFTYLGSPAERAAPAERTTPAAAAERTPATASSAELPAGVGTGCGTGRVEGAGGQQEAGAAVVSGPGLATVGPSSTAGTAQGAAVAAGPEAHAAAGERLPGEAGAARSTCLEGGAGPLDESVVQLGPLALKLPGSLLSPAQLWLARLVLASPSLLLQRTLLELGSPWQPATGLPSLAALRWCRFVVATATSAAGLATVRRSAQINAPRVLIERLRLQRLSWHGASAPASLGHGTDSAAAAAAADMASQQAALLGAFPAGFDLVVGADVLGAAVCQVPGGEQLQEQEEGGAALVAQQVAALLASHGMALLCQASTSTKAAGGDWLEQAARVAVGLGLQRAELPGGTAVERLVQQAAGEGVAVLCLCRRQNMQARDPLRD